MFVKFIQSHTVKIKFVCVWHMINAANERCSAANNLFVISGYYETGTDIFTLSFSFTDPLQEISRVKYLRSPLQVLCASS